MKRHVAVTDPTCVAYPDKTRFRDHTSAARTLSRIREQGHPSARAGNIPVRAYQCPSCKGWHLTKEPE